MTQGNKIATIFGGTGFIGTQIVRELAKKGWTIKVATRVPESAYFLRPNGAVGQVVPFACDYSDPKSIASAVQGAEVVVNCIGILFKRKKGDFARTHTEIPGTIAKMCKKEGVERFVHISAAGIETNKSRYAESKREGEKAVQKNFPDATILKPSIVFGPEDDFFNKFAELSRYLPFLPLIGGGKTRFQPVFVGDVADAVMAAIERPDTGDASPLGQSYELGGPEVLTFEDIYERIFSYTKRRRPLVSLPWWIAKIQAFFMGLLPKPLLTIDQVNSLKTDSVVSKNALTLSDLGVQQTALDVILPRYLKSYQAGGRFGDLKEA